MYTRLCLIKLCKSVKLLFNNHLYVLRDYMYEVIVNGRGLVKCPDK